VTTYRCGKTTSGTQRYQCATCHKTFTWHCRGQKKHREFHWFKLWVLESFSVRQLNRISGHSPAKIKRIKNYWLQQSPPANTVSQNCRYLLFDGTYFHKDGCLLVVMQARRNHILSTAYVAHENYASTLALFTQLRQKGVLPKAITLDGHLSVMRAVRVVWPEVILQRCLCHIQREGMRWLRSYPKTLAGQQLRALLRNLSAINTPTQRDRFWGLL